LDNTENNKNEIDVRQESRRKTGIVCIVIAVLFCIAIAAVPLITIIIPDKQMSQSENRVLKQRPSFSLSAIADGSFMDNFEKYLSDQFPLRDKVISSKTSFDRIIGQKQENGVYIGKKNYLFEKQTAFDEAHVKTLTDAIDAFSKKYPKLKKAFILSPNSSCLLSEYLPSGVKEPDQREQLKKIQTPVTKSGFKWIDCAKLFDVEKDKTALFYRTDHHWTTRAAYSAFQSLSKEWKLNSKVKYSFSTVSDSFQGTLASSSGVNNITDKVEICVPASSKSSYIVSYETSGKKTATLFEKEKLNQKNQYEVFLGGNYDKVIISTAEETKNTLLLLKDSYANCMIPMLTPYFSKIVVIDPRYLSDSLSEIMKEYQFTHMLFVYNVNTFIADTSLVDVLGG